MADSAGSNARRVARERLESQLFDALGVVHTLPRREAVELAGFAAGLMAAHLADIAALETSTARDDAQAALLRLQEDVRDLVEALEERAGGPERDAPVERLLRDRSG